MKKYNHIVFDLETTGLELENQIIEIGATKYDEDFNYVDSFQSFVSLYKIQFIPEEITNLTGIIDSDLEDAPHISEVLPKFYEFATDNNQKNFIAYAHNASFDLKHLNSALVDANLDLFYINNKNIQKKIFIDTVKMAKEHNAATGVTTSNHKLSTLLREYKTLFEDFNVEYDSESHHRADYDSNITGKLVKFFYDTNEVHKKNIDKVIKSFNNFLVKQNKKD